jgi:hypothetical protein
VERPVLPPACLQDPPPTARQVRLARAADGCPSSFAACLTDEAAAVMRANVLDERRWMRDAWILCGRAPAAPAESSYGGGAPGGSSSGTATDAGAGGER